MRSIFATLLLALVSFAVIGLACIQWKLGNFDIIFGRPAVPIGETLYNNFQPDDVARIEIRSGNLEGVFEREGQFWQTLTPWKDRMDPVAAAAIIRFSLGLRVEDYCPADKIKRSESGLDQKAVHIRLNDKDGETLARYKIGRISSWKAEIEGIETPVNTMFILPKDEADERHIYLCTGDISALFQKDLKLLRDHRPLYFNPLNLQKISIQSQQGEITLGHEHPQHPWRIIKPLNLSTDRIAMQALIEGLFNLRATKVSNRREVTLPTNGAAMNSTKIILYRFGQQEPTSLEIYAPESLEATSLMAVVSDRPDTVFELPAKPTPGQISLADLPLDLNALRDATLTRLNITALKSILISPATGIPILISREDPQPWMATIGGKSFLANEQNLYKLLKSVTSTQVNGFVSDAATDFSAWGLDRPILTIRFLAKSNEAIELRFGINSKGEYFANRTGSPTVIKIDGALINSISVLPHEWKHALLWSLNRSELTTLVIKKPGQEQLILKHNFLEPDDPWTAELKFEDVTLQLVQAHANFLLSQLEGIEVSRWLASDDADALAALGNPTLNFIAEETIKDEDDKILGKRIRSLILAPTKKPELFRFYYGLLQGETNPFLIDMELYQKLNAQVFEN